MVTIASRTPRPLVTSIALALGACGGEEGSAGDVVASSSPPAVAPSSPTTGAPGASGPSPTGGESAGFRYAFSPTSVAISCERTAAELRASGAPIVSFGDAAIVVGYEQISQNDQDPIVARLEGDRLVFCDHTKKGGGPDARGYGITWNGRDTLYGLFTVVGGGTAFDAAAKGGWMPAYGDGGGSAKVMVVAKLSATTGALERATYLPAKVVKNGQPKTNTLVPAAALEVRDDGALQIRADSAFCSLNPDRTSMCAEGGTDYPKGYVARLSPDLSRMICASATGVSVVKTPCP